MYLSNLVDSLDIFPINIVPLHFSCISMVLLLLNCGFWTVVLYSNFTDYLLT